MVSISSISINHNFILDFSDFLLLLFMLFPYQKPYIYGRGILSVPFLITRRYIKLFEVLVAFLCAFTHKILVVSTIVLIVLLLNFLPPTGHTNNSISALIIYTESKGICKLSMIIQRGPFCLGNWFHRRRVFR